jgi:hypothetical protein
VAIARPYFNASSAELVELLTSHPTAEVIHEAKFRTNGKVKKALASLLDQTVPAPTPVVSPTITLTEAQLRAIASVDWFRAYEAGSVENRQKAADAAYERAMRGEGQILVTPAPVSAPARKASRKSGKFNPLKVSAAAVANLSGHKPGSIGWWDAYKAQTALQREHNITAADFEGMTKEQVIAAAQPVKA